MAIRVFIMGAEEEVVPETDFVNRFIEHVNKFDAPLKVIEESTERLIASYKTLDHFVNTPIKERDLAVAIEESKLLSITQIDLYRRISKIADIVNDIRDHIRPSQEEI